MRRFYKLALRLRSLFRKSRVEKELADELRFHLEKLIEEKVGKGMSPEEARYAALRELGGVEQIKEECRDMRRVNYIENFFQDLRYGLRMLAKSPGFTVVVLVTLALGIGVNTAIFNVVYAVLLKPLPYPDPNRLMLLETVEALPGQPSEVNPWWSYPRLQALRDGNKAFEQVAAVRRRDFVLTGTDNPERVEVEFVSSSYFSMLGVKPVLGRTFLTEEDKIPGAQPVALVGYELWKRRFSADPNLLGKTLHVNQIPLTVVGILPEGFKGQSGSAEVWAPMMMVPALFGDPQQLTYPSFYWHSVIGRLKHGITQAQALAEMKVVGRQIEEEYPMAPGEMVLGVTMIPLRESMVDPTVRKSLMILLVAVGFVLLIACVNTANLMLARASTRQREIGIRLAVGASRGRLMRQILTESLVLAFLAGFLGLAAALWGVDLLARFQPPSVGFFSGFAHRLDPNTSHIEVHVLTFGLLISFVTGILFGVLPAWHASRFDVAQLSKGSPGDSKSFSRVAGLPSSRGFLVICELALAFVLLIGAGLMVNSFTRVLAIDLGVVTDGLLTVGIDLPQRYTSMNAANFAHQAVSRLGALPGVQSVSLLDCIPLSGLYDTTSMRVERPSLSTEVGVHPADPGLLRTLGIPLERGRWLTEQDGPGARKVAVINETAARRLWPGEDPLGRRISLGISNIGFAAEVVGVVGDVRYSAIGTPVGPEVYLSYLQYGHPSFYLLIRTSQDPASLVAVARHEILALDKDLPVDDVKTMSQRLEDYTSRTRFSTFLLSLFACVALILSAVGLYGVVAYSVARRTHEIGIRMALGARQPDVLKLVVSQGMVLTLVGVALGLAGALGLTRFLVALLYGVRPTDPATFLAVSIVLTGVALVASYIPARRATKVDPMVSLRYE